MIINLKRTKAFEVKYLKAECGVRYWEDATVNGAEDEDGSLIPCRSGDAWTPTIELETGIIQDWPRGTTAEIFYKVCDDGTYRLISEDGSEVIRKNGYVPRCMSPKENGYGDYVAMDVDETGRIIDWSADLSYFIEDE